MHAARAPMFRAMASCLFAACVGMEGSCRRGVLPIRPCSDAAKRTQYRSKRASVTEEASRLRVAAQVADKAAQMGKVSGKKPATNATHAVIPDLLG